MSRTLGSCILHPYKVHVLDVFRPNVFLGGSNTKCFRFLKEAGFTIVSKGSTSA